MENNTSSYRNQDLRVFEVSTVQNSVCTTANDSKLWRKVEDYTSKGTYQPEVIRTRFRDVGLVVTVKKEAWCF